MSRRANQYQALAQALFSLAKLLTVINGLFQESPAQQRTEQIHRLRSYNLALKNEHEEQKILRTCTQQGLDEKKLELLELKIKRERWAQKNAGIDTPSFVAVGYAEPGDVRRGVYVQ